MNEALEYQRCCNDAAICEQLLSHIIRTSVNCKLFTGFQLFTTRSLALCHCSFHSQSTNNYLFLTWLVALAMPRHTSAALSGTSSVVFCHVLCKCGVQVNIHLLTVILCNVNMHLLWPPSISYEHTIQWLDEPFQRSCHFHHRAMFYCFNCFRNVFKTCCYVT